MDAAGLKSRQNPPGTCNAVSPPMGESRRCRGPQGQRRGRNLSRFEPDRGLMHYKGGAQDGLQNAFGDKLPTFTRGQFSPRGRGRG